jgi:hypothetical protein
MRAASLCSATLVSGILPIDTDGSLASVPAFLRVAGRLSQVVVLSASSCQKV